MSQQKPNLPKVPEPLIEFVETVPVAYIVAALVAGALIGIVGLILYDMSMANREANQNIVDASANALGMDQSE